MTLADAAAEHTQLRRRGRRLVGRCPFEHSPRTTFAVNVEQGLFYCFSCRKGGDLAAFLREIG